MITVTVVYPIYLQIEESEIKGKTAEEIKQYVFDKSGQHLESSQVDPIIHESSDESLIPID